MSEDFTEALSQYAEGHPEDLNELLPALYDQLRALAYRELGRERAGHTLGATALVHEAYLKLVRLDRVSWKGRTHFFAAAAREMRRVLISYARARNAQKRGGGGEHVNLDDVIVAARAHPQELIELDEALERLAQRDARQARAVECRYFAGMSVEETAEALGTSPATVKRDWTLARAWLNRELSR